MSFYLNALCILHCRFNLIVTVTCLSICCYFLLRSQTCFVQEHFKRHIFLLQKWKQKCYYSCLPVLTYCLQNPLTPGWGRVCESEAFPFVQVEGKPCTELQLLYSSHSPVTRDDTWEARNQCAMLTCRTKYTDSFVICIFPPFCSLEVAEMTANTRLAHWHCDPLVFILRPDLFVRVYRH